MSTFVKATKKQAKARIALDGPSGSGKTWTSLVTATALADGGKVAVIDSERGSASKYAADFDFDVLELDGNFHPDRYIDGLRLAAREGYAVAVVDSLTHAWAGHMGVLEQVDAAKARFGGNSHMAWSVGTPMWQALIDAMVQSPLHVIATMRSKTKWVEQEDSRGKKSYQRAGTEPVARDGVEYEFDVVADLDLEHNLVVAKSRAGRHIESLYRRPGPEFGEAVLMWLTDGAPDVDALARELIATAGDPSALAAAMKKAKLRREDLGDEAKLAKARQLAADIASTREAAQESDAGGEGALSLTPPPDGEILEDAPSGRAADPDLGAAA